MIGIACIFHSFPKYHKVFSKWRQHIQKMVWAYQQYKLSLENKTCALLKLNIYFLSTLFTSVSMQYKQMNANTYCMHTYRLLMQSYRVMLMPNFKLINIIRSQFHSMQCYVKQLIVPYNNTWCRKYTLALTKPN